MDLVTAIVLGIIQGITEWLPISSEAMVTLAGRFLFNMEYSEALGTAIWLHGGTAFAAVIYFREEIIKIIQSIYKKDSDKSLLIFLIITTFFSAVIAISLITFLFSMQIPDVYFTLLIGLFLIGIAFLHKNKKQNIISKNLTKTKAVIIGLIQGTSILPGISRSGITIPVLLLEDFSLKQSFKLSFLMSIPVTLGASVFIPIIKQDFVLSLPLILSGIIAFIVGLLTIKLLMDFAEKINFYKATLVLGLFIILLAILQFVL